MSRMGCRELRAVAGLKSVAAVIDRNESKFEWLTMLNADSLPNIVRQTSTDVHISKF